MRIRCDTLSGVPNRVLHCQQSTPGVTENGDRFKLEAAADMVDIVHIGGDRHITGFHPIGGPTASALVGVDEAECVGQSIQFRQEVVVVEVRAIAEHDHRMTPVDVAIEEPGTSRIHKAVAGSHGHDRNCTGSPDPSA